MKTYRDALENVVFLLHTASAQHNRPKLALCELVGLLYETNPVQVMKDVDALMDGK